MALTLKITETFDTTDELLTAIEHIAGLIGEGYTSGFHPGWSLDGEQDLPPEQHHEDCDYRNSHAARETAITLNVDVEEHAEVFDCNLDCNRR